MGLSGFDKLRNVDMDCLHNNGRFGLGYSIGCWTTAFDYDAVAEHYVRNPQGGGVAFIGNSSYGWGAPGNPRFGYSDRFDAQFFHELFSAPEPHVGEVLAQAKRHFIPYSREANVYRWHQYCLNLMGDPEMPVHTDTLAPIRADLPLRLPVGHDLTRIAVWDNEGPVSGAVVCIRKGEETWVHGRTGLNGAVVLEPACATPGWAEVVITAANHRPLIDSVAVADGPHIALTRLEVADSTTGDGNGLAGPGESFSLRLTLRNAGTSPARGLFARLTSESPLLSIHASQTLLPGLAPGDTANFTAFPLSISPDASNGQVAVCTLTVHDSLGAWWDDPIAIQIAEPDIRILDFDETHLGTWYVEPGDTMLVRILVCNAGLAPAAAGAGTLFRADPYLNPDVPALVFPPLGAGETTSSLNRARVVVSSDCPAPRRAAVGVNYTAPGVRTADTLRFLVGRALLSTRIDSTGSAWTHGGTPDIWRPTRNRAGPWDEWVFHAGGDSGPYPDGCVSWLQTPAFTMPDSAELELDYRYWVPTYGADGLYVIVVTAARQETLDFIGSGGALRPSGIADCRLPIEGQDGIASDWFSGTYDLSSCEPGESAHIRLTFVSDNDGVTAEGFYVSDVFVHRRGVRYHGWPQVDSSRIVAVFPSPFSHQTTIIYAVWGIEYGAYASLRVYDRSGRLVRALANSYIGNGYYAVAWDGRDDSGRTVPAGVYFLQLEAASVEAPERVMPPSHIRRRVVLAR
jgi:hypothetical protein